MTDVVEISKNHQHLIWQAHLLSEVMRKRGLDHLAFEPVLDSAEACEIEVKFKATETSLEWDWANWKEVEIVAADGNQTNLIRTYPRSKPAVAQWRDFSGISEVDVTFRSTDGVVARTRVEIPELAAFGRHVQFTQRLDNTVTIQLEPEVAVGRIEVYWLRLAMDREYRPSGPRFQFPAGTLKLRVPIPDEFFGILAVVAERDNHHQLLSAADFNSHKQLIPQNAADTQVPKVREWVEGRSLMPRKDPKTVTVEQWINSWPKESQQCLVSLYEAGKQHLCGAPVIGDELLRDYPTGFARYLMLAETGYESTNPSRLLRQLNDADFQRALDSTCKGLGSALAKLTSTEEREWAIQHAGNHNVLEAVQDAANEGIRALARALHLANRRAEAIAAWQRRSTRISASV